MVIEYNNGKEVDCIFHCGMLEGYITMTACEYFCKRYYRCDNIALADDELKEAEYASTVKVRGESSSLVILNRVE